MLILDLCIQFGKPQKELLSWMSVDDLIEMAAYRRIKPFGYDIENRRFGTICSAIYNSAGKTYKKNVEWNDIFKPSWKKESKKVDPVVSLIAALSALSEKQKDGKQRS